MAVEWLSRHIPKLESWEDVQDTKTNQGASTLGRVVADLGRTVAGFVAGAILGFCCITLVACSLVAAVMAIFGIDPEDEVTRIMGRIVAGACAAIGATMGAAYS